MRRVVKKKSALFTIKLIQNIFELALYFEINDKSHSGRMTRQRVNTKTRAHSFFPLWIRQRELSHRLSLGHSDVFYKSLYSSISMCHSWCGGKTSKSEHGGIFSLEFSPDGTHLVASCEQNSLLMFDPLSRRLIRTVQNVHTGHVTHVKFLDSRIFATGGDEGEVFLWDTRNLKSRFQTLQGHSSALASIEFSRKNHLLITSAFDGIIYLWDMKSWNLRERTNNSTFLSHVLLCLRLNSDETKMIVSMGGGYFFIVHQLDLNTLPQDLVGFGLGMCEFEYHYQTFLASSQNRNCFLSSNRRRNHVEIVADFPNARDCNVISALEFHPQGWGAFSRIKCEKNRKEWTCVHDIQEQEPSEAEAPAREGSGDEDPPRPQRHETISEEQRSATVERGSTGRSNMGFCLQSRKEFSSELQDATLSLEKEVRERRSESPEDAAWGSPPSGSSSASPHPPEPAGLGSNPASTRLDHILPCPNSSVAQLNRKVHVNCPRLTHFIEESYSSEWYIESMGVSADGRLVCSPFKSGIRLLTFSPECSEYTVPWCGTKPGLLYELSTHTFHNEIVLCSKFSPRHCLLVSGCVNSNLAWYQPVV